MPPSLTQAAVPRLIYSSCVPAAVGGGGGCGSPALVSHVSGPHSRAIGSFPSRLVQALRFQGGDPLERPAPPGWCMSPPGPSPSLPSPHLPWEKKVTGEHSRGLAQSEGHVLTSAPEWQPSTTTLSFRGSRGKKGPSSPHAQEGAPSPQGQVSELPLSDAGRGESSESRGETSDKGP